MIIIGGVLHIVIGIFHLFFERLFKYETDLKRLSFINGRIALILNKILTVFLFGVGFISIVHSNEFKTTGLGRTLTCLLASVWIYRVFLQVKYFPLNNLRSWIIISIFSTLAFCYSITLFGFKYG
jgi:hypothetical protein